MVHAPPILEDEKLTARITFHTKPSVDERLSRIVEKSALDRPDWLRRWLEVKLSEIEADEMAEADVVIEDVSDEPLAVQLAAAKAQIAGLEQVNHLLNERLGMSDAQNIELNRRLESSLTTVERFTLALPPGTTVRSDKWFPRWIFRGRR